MADRQRLEQPGAVDGETAIQLPIPPSWTASTAGRQRFFDLLAGAPRPLLICDYDGTLAPFREDKMQAVPYPGVAERLERIAAGRTRLAFVSGRPVRELIQLLPLARNAEVWGMHGREHRTPGPDATARYTLLQPTAAQRAALDSAQAALEARGLGSLLERKAASIALHWRTLDTEQQSERQREVQRLAQEAFAAHAGTHALAVLPFDGGLELRAEDRTKGHATESLLDGADASAAAFLGDDTTDEDAFRVMRAHGGLGLLVREPPRSSLAGFSIHPPGELLAFLDDWLQTTGKTGSPAR